MGSLVIKKECSELSEKAGSLMYLQELGFPVPPALVIPMFSEGDYAAIESRGGAEYYYVRLCFRDKSSKRRVGRIVHADEVDPYLVELAKISESDTADLVIQPFVTPSYSGAVMRMGDVVFVEAAYGIAPTLFHRGRFSHRGILSQRRLICSESVDQVMALIWQSGSITKVEAPGWTEYDPQAVFVEIAAMVDRLDNVLLEWGIVDGGLVFFDHKDVPPSSGFLQLLEKPPLIPRSVTASVKEIEESPQPKRLLRLDYPDFVHLPQAQASDFVVIRKGALLSHLSVYSLYQGYKCAFQG
jgi:hypothetical protein